MIPNFEGKQMEKKIKSIEGYNGKILFLNAVSSIECGRKTIPKKTIINDVLNLF
jgi:hypothetical protein